MDLSSLKINFQDLSTPKIGYYTTGGLGNKIPLILAPLMASAGVSVPMISGSPLNTQDNTLDKFESIPGIKTSLSLEEFQTQLLDVGGVIAMLPKEITGSHQKIYEIPDSSTSEIVTNAIERFILNQKLAGGIQGIVFDVKVGESSSLKSRHEARNFAKCLERVCNRLQIRFSFLLSALDQPLGESVGNSLEVIEAIKVLKGNGPLDVLKLALELGSEMHLLANKLKIKTEAKNHLRGKIEEGEAVKKFEEIIKAQGGNPQVISNSCLFPYPKMRRRVYSPKKGYIHSIKTTEISHLWQEIATSQQERDNSGFLFFKKIGDRIEEGEVMAEVHLNEPKPAIESQLQDAFILSKNPPEFKPFIIESIRKS